MPPPPTPTDEFRCKYSLTANKQNAIIVVVVVIVIIISMHITRRLSCRDHHDEHHTARYYRDICKAGEIRMFNHVGRQSLGPASRLTLFRDIPSTALMQLYLTTNGRFELLIYEYTSGLILYLV